MVSSTNYYYELLSASLPGRVVAISSLIKFLRGNGTMTVGATTLPARQLLAWS